MAVVGDKEMVAGMVGSLFSACRACGDELPSMGAEIF
jgi:hypothetical protein